MLKLKNSGYNRKYRIEILDSALKGFEKMVEEDRKGTKPLFRNRNWKKEEREAQKKEKRLNWYKNEGKNGIQYTSVLFVPPTPGGILAKQLRKREEELNKHNSERIKIVEKGGENVENILTKKDPFEKETCKEKMCPLCTGTKKRKIFCNTNNVGYRWVCNTCKEDDKTRVYEGETSRSGRLRGIEHVRALKNKREDSVLYKHQMVEHGGMEADFKLEITGVFSDALSRQADEAVRISTRKKYELMNSKTEFNHPPIARVVIEKNPKPKRFKLSPGL